MLAPTTILTQLADASSAASVMRDFVAPVVGSLCAAAGLVAVFFLVSGGYQYLTSAGQPERLMHAKHVIRNALLGLIIVIGASTLTAILTHAYSGAHSALNASLPPLTSLQPQPVSNGLVDILIKAITGLFNNIIQSIAAPFLHALSFFTSGTPLMANNSSVFNLWLVVVGITDVLFTLVVALLGFHVMSASTFGFDEIEFKHLLPRLALVFLLINISIFAIDGVIELSNAMIHAVNAAGASSVWDSLTDIVKQSGGLGVASLMIMIVFLIFSVILLVYYVGRLVTLYLGAVLSPLIAVLWLIPGFRDFSETAIKTYLTTVFVLFVHVVILELAASLFASLVVGSPTPAPNDLMALVVGLATIIALLKTQGVMLQFSYASMGARNTRKLGSQFMTGVSYLGSRGRSVVETVSSRRNQSTVLASSTTKTSRSATQAGATYKQPSSRQSATQSRNTNNPGNKSSRSAAVDKAKTGTTTVAPKVAKPMEPKGKDKS